MSKTKEENDEFVLPTKSKQTKHSELQLSHLEEQNIKNQFLSYLDESTELLQLLNFSTSFSSNKKSTEEIINQEEQ